MKLKIIKNPAFLLGTLVLVLSSQFKDTLCSDEKEIATKAILPDVSVYEDVDSVIGISVSDEIAECVKKHANMKKCVNEILPLLVDFGLPTNRYEMETICKSFNTAMDCMTAWVNQCETEEKANKFNEYIAPAVETYSVMCKDKRTKASFYRHGSCFKKISNDFDTCVDKLDVEQQSAGDKQPKQICCHRQNFLKCVGRVLDFHKCELQSRKKIMETAEYTVEFRTARKNNSKMDCLQLTETECMKMIGPMWDSFSPSLSSSPGFSISILEKAVMLILASSIRFMYP